MSFNAAIGGPVSQFLEAELRKRVQQPDVVVWLDLDDHYSPFVDRLIGAREAGLLPYEVRAFRGSYLELILSLEGLGNSVDRTPLLIHLPNHTEETVRQTPMYELYAIGKRHRKALDTLVREASVGRVRPDLIAAFVERDGLTLEGADTWLEVALSEQEGGLATQLAGMKPIAFIDDLLGDGFVSEHLAVSGEYAALWERLAVWTGLPESWRRVALPQARPGAADVAFAAASWALCVEYVDDLHKDPEKVSESVPRKGIRELPRQVIDTCRELAAHLRERHEAFYRRTADETEAFLGEEIGNVTAAHLGRVDTFRFEEDKVLKAALAALEAKQWHVAADSERLRTSSKRGEGSFWVRHDPTRQSAWHLVGDAARLGLAIEKAGPRLDGAGGMEPALERYMKHGAAVDQAHRHLEQHRVSLLYPQLPEFEALRARLDAMRKGWRAWADSWARDFNAVCKSHGFLPAPSQQQRTLFDEVVRPLSQESGPTAYFVVDALRYEMGEELYRALGNTPAATVSLKGRLAELPTVTEVGMNVLAPVDKAGRLRPTIADGSDGKVQGFSTGEFRVAEPDSRKRAMHERVGGGTCPWLNLEDVLSRDNQTLKRTVAQARLVVVHSQEIDKAGENGAGPAVFDTVLQQLRAAWRLLREAGVRRFVFTADHGFLLLDDQSASAQRRGRLIDPSRRHTFSYTQPAQREDEVQVSMAELGYEGASGYWVFPETTAVFDTGRRPMGFVHGGNSLQERLIPVLTVIHRAGLGGSTLSYRISSAALEGVGGMHCLEATVEMDTQRELNFGSPKEIELVLRVVEIPGVQVELCQTRGKARISGGAVIATVGSRFELFFRLTGHSEARALVELHHPGGSVEAPPSGPDTRFAVAAAMRVAAPLQAAEPDAGIVSTGSTWLAQLPEGGARQVFEHLAAHGTVTEPEATKMLGGPRGMRRFAIQFDDLVKKAPFDVRIDVVSGVKRYVREGSGS